MFQDGKFHYQIEFPNYTSSDFIPIETSVLTSQNDFNNKPYNIEFKNDQYIISASNKTYNVLISTLGGQLLLEENSQSKTVFNKANSQNLAIVNISIDNKTYTEKLIW